MLYLDFLGVWEEVGFSVELLKRMAMLIIEGNGGVVLCG
jgi:hypothetical protein